MYTQLQLMTRFPSLIFMAGCWALARISSLLGLCLLIYLAIHPDPSGTRLLWALGVLVGGLVVDLLVGVTGTRDIGKIFDIIAEELRDATASKARTEELIVEAEAGKVETERLFTAATAAKLQTDELFGMTDMLQSADGYDDATAVLMATSLRLVPEFGASLYIFNNSRDRLDLAGSWNMPEGFQQGETLAPGNCWALKRGKPHINHPGKGTLCCSHHGGGAASLEIPMMARGSVYGLLTFVSDDERAEERLGELSRMGQALADSMSLALSNISLREKLRTQSLRDPLTGLYNRRYMEDALERYLNLAERTGGSTAVLMVDLDNFKRLNDDHGHAKGDAVLRDVAAQMVGGLRPADVVCRYGGEELLAILPNCSIEDAALKAEIIRERIEGLSDAHQVSVSASIGIAAVPDTSTSASDLVPMADAALYEAKRAGKNRVVCASKRPVREDSQPRLVTA